MSYQKQNFANGEVLTASQLNHIENGIVDVESAVSEIKDVVAKIIDPTLSVSGKAADAAKVGEAVNAEAERAKGVEGQIKEDISNKITKFYASNQGETYLSDSDNGKIQDMIIYGKSSQDGTPSPENPVEIKSVVNPVVKLTNEDKLKVQSVTLNNITLNAIPISSGGNVTIDGQQYVADYVDVERGKLVRNIENATFNGAENENWTLWNEDKDKLWSFMFQNSVKIFVNESASKCNRFEFDVDESTDNRYWLCSPSNNPSIQIRYRTVGKDVSAFKTWLSKNPVVLQYALATPTETDLTPEEIQVFKALATYYPVTNISVNSEQLDGYTVFNYPISMQNGWNYVKQQLNDNRDYIYDMDLQPAEAYVNSEYAVALTELEV